MMPQSTTGAVVIALAITTSLHAVDVDESWVDRLDGSAGMNDYGEAVAVAATDPCTWRDSCSSQPARTCSRRAS